MVTPAPSDFVQSGLAHGCARVQVTSPLTRAIQTCLIGLEAAGLTAVGPNEFGPKLLAVGQQDEARKFCALAPVHVRAEIAEHLATSGDVGRPRCFSRPLYSPALSSSAPGGSVGRATVF